MSHTPGPWDALWPKFDAVIVDAEERVIASVSFTDHVDTECEANARLIAAAPELLAALKEYIEWFGPVHGAECPADDTCDCIGEGLNARVNAAIRKAEGAE